MKKVVISVLGQDRPGIIAAVSGILFAEGCNIENVDQTILQSEFSGIFIAGIPVERNHADLHKCLLEGLEDMGLNVFIKPLDHSQPRLEFGESETFVYTTRGPDKKGLVASITRVIADYGVNVTNLQAVFRGSDNPSDNIMIYEVDVPSDVVQKDLHADLRRTAERLGLEISIQHRKIFEALNRVWISGPRVQGSKESREKGKTSEIDIGIEIDFGFKRSNSALVQFRSRFR